jgi:hypothetical protein
MDLQKTLMEKVNLLGGIKEFTKNLNFLKFYFSDEDKIFITNIINFYNLLFKTKIDVAALNLKFYQLALETLNVLFFYQKTIKNKYLDFIIEAIELQLNYLQNVKLLA